MRLLAVPNWSFGRSKILLHKFEAILESGGVNVHYLRGDLDHNRTVSAVSGESEAVIGCLKAMALEAFDAIDLNHHVGVHPRIGALDVCPFLPLRQSDEETIDELTQGAQEAVNEFGAWVGEQGVPVFLYERSARPGHAESLTTLRKGGFGGMLGQQLLSDFGPDQVHPHLGAAVIGVRGFLVALNVNLSSPSPLVAQIVAAKIRKLRNEGDARFLGVRALGFALPSMEMSQVSLNVTLPDFTPLDSIIDFAEEEAGQKGTAFAGTELIGVIRPRDLEHGTRINPQPGQIVEGTI